MTSPAITIYDDSVDFNYSNLKFYYYTEKSKSIIDRPNWFGTRYKDKDWKTNEERFHRISNWALSALKENNVKEAFLEGYSYGSKGSAVFHIAENTGYLKAKLHTEGILFSTIAPTQAKKSFSGNGGASKIFMEETFFKKTGIEIRKLLNLTLKQENPSSDIVDSLAMLECGMELKNIPLWRN